MNKKEISQLLIETAEILDEGILNKIEEKKINSVDKILDEIRFMIDKNKYKDYFINIQEMSGIIKSNINLIGLDVQRDRSNKQDFSYHLYTDKYHKWENVKYSYDTLITAIRADKNLRKFL